MRRQLVFKNSINLHDLTQQTQSGQSTKTSKQQLSQSLRRPSMQRKPIVRISNPSNNSNTSQDQNTYSVIFTNNSLPPKRKLQTSNCDLIEESRNSSTKQMKPLITPDINNTKQILTSILQGMQHKIAADKPIGVIGMSVVPCGVPILITTQPVRKKALSQERESPYPKRQYVHNQTKQLTNKTRKQPIKSAKPSQQSNNNKQKQMQTPPSNTQLPNFRFSLTEYSVLSREQLFQAKLQNYHYFLFLISIQSNFYTIPNETSVELSFKIGRGNNSRIIKEAFKQRWWWTVNDNNIEEEYKEPNFIWTQIKIQEYLNKQEHKQYIITKNDDKQNKQIILKQQEPLLRIMYDDTQIKLIERSTNDYLKYINENNIQLFNVSNQLKLHNHIELNYHIGNKKALYHNLKKYFELTKQDLNSIIPLTFHVQKGTKDKVYLQFLEHYKRQPKGTFWIIKPGEMTNRGTGITVCQSLGEINRLITKKQTHQDGKPFTYLIQKYIEKPFLYNKRKFDIRCYMLITHINGIMRTYFYEDGYIRTSSEEFDLDDPANVYVHLTNDAIQKNADTYSKFENGNKLSYSEFQRYLGQQYDFQQLLRRIVEMATITIKATYCKMIQSKKTHNFELLGLDFMIDQDFKPYLIEVNTNPCLETGSPVLQRIIPFLVESVLRLTVDTLVPPPDAQLWPPCKKHYLFYDNLLENNKFQLIFDEKVDAQPLLDLYQGQSLEEEIGIIEEEDEYKSESEETQ